MAQFNIVVLSGDGIGPEVVNEAVKVLKLRYPGLPESMLGKYVLETAKTAWELPTNAIFRISIEQDKVELFGANVSKTYVMWDKQPT